MLQRNFLVGLVSCLALLCFTGFMSQSAHASTSAVASADKLATPSSDSAKTITSFKIFGDGTIDQERHTINVVVPYDADITSLNPVIVIDGASVSPASGVAYNFTDPHQTYTVTAKDGSTQKYLVTVSSRLPDTAVTPMVTPVNANGELLPAPLVSITRVPDHFSLPSGPGLVSYSFMVSNPGIVSIHNISVVDNRCFPMHYVSGDMNHDYALDPNEVWMYNCAIPVAKLVTGTATVEGDGNGFHVIDTGSSTVVNGRSVITPIIHVIVRPDRFILPRDENKIRYVYTLTNPGAIALSDVTVTDDICGQVFTHSGDVNKNNLLEPDETWTYSCETTLNNSTKNTVKASGRAGEFSAMDYAIATVIVGSDPAWKSYGLRAGDMISSRDSSANRDIFQLNSFGYKRLFLNSLIFNMYANMSGLSAVKYVSTAIRDSLMTSNLLRNCDAGDGKVYQLETKNKGLGILHWLHLSADSALSMDGDFFKKVFCTKGKELNSYKRGADILMIGQNP